MFNGARNLDNMAMQSQDYDSENILFCIGGLLTGKIFFIFRFTFLDITANPFAWVLQGQKQPGEEQWRTRKTWKAGAAEITAEDWKTFSAGVEGEDDNDAQITQLRTFE